MSAPHGLDPAALANLRRLGGDDFLAKMIDLFLEHTPRRVQAARAEQQAGNLPGVALAAHSIKSSAANLGARALQDLAARLEEAATASQTDVCATLVPELEAAFQQAVAWLTAERKGLES